MHKYIHVRKIPEVNFLCQTYIVAIFKFSPELASIGIYQFYSPAQQI